MTGLDLLNILKAKSEEELVNLQVRVPTPVISYQQPKSMVKATDIGFGIRNIDILALGEFKYME